MSPLFLSWLTELLIMFRLNMKNNQNISLLFGIENQNRIRMAMLVLDNRLEAEAEPPIAKTD